MPVIRLSAPRKTRSKAKTFISVPPCASRTRRLSGAARTKIFSPRHVDDLFYIDDTANGVAVIIVKDRNGNTVGYSKAVSIKIQPPLGYIMLRESGSLEEVEIDGEKHQVLKFSGEESIYRYQYVSRNDIHLTIGPLSILAVELVLNGFIASIGDKIYYEIIIIDPRF